MKIMMMIILIITIIIIPGCWGGILLSSRVRSNNYGFRGKTCGGMMLPYLPCFT